MSNSSVQPVRDSSHIWVPENYYCVPRKKFRPRRFCNEDCFFSFDLISPSIRLRTNDGVLIIDFAVRADLAQAR